jgi:hypothetical protein
MNRLKKLFKLPWFLLLVIFIEGILLSSTAVDKAGIPLLKWMGPGRPGTYEDYLAGQESKPVQVKELQVLRPALNRYMNLATETKKVLLLVNPRVFSGLHEKILRYGIDLNLHGYEVALYEYSGGNPGHLKSFIISRKQNLSGCVFIGNFPVAWYEVEDDFYEYGYAEFPCDLFFMDLDGQWRDTDGNERYDLHQDGSGDRMPEIFIGRIDGSRMEGDEIEILNRYFDKNHEYWSGNIYIHQYGLTYTEDDWSIYEDMLNDISYLYDNNYEAISAPATDRNDYLDNRLNNVKYEYIQLACHSSSNAHHFVRNGLLTSNQVRDAPPLGLSYNLFCCSALRYTDYNCLGTSYIFNQGQKALSVVGSTKTGSMLEFRFYYQSLGARNPLGTALKEWFERIAPYDIYDVFWHYGMTVLGDPLMVMLSGERDIYPPLFLNGGIQENRSLLMTEYINVLNWDTNPLNEGKGISGYRIYLLQQEGYTWLHDLDLNEYEFLHRGVDKGDKYVYAVVAINSTGEESRPAIVEICDPE